MRASSRDRRGAARGGQHVPGIGGQAAVAQQVLDDRGPERRPGRPGPAPTSGGGSAAARQARRHAARSSTSTHGVPGPQVDGRRGRAGPAARGAGGRAAPARPAGAADHERAGAAPARHPALGEQLVVGRGRHRPAHAERRRPARGSTAAGRRPAARPSAVAARSASASWTASGRSASRSSGSGGRSTSGLSNRREVALPGCHFGAGHAGPVTLSTAPRRSTVTRLRERARTDRAELYAVLDAGPGLPPRAGPRRRAGRAAHRLRPHRRHRLPARLHRRRLPAGRSTAPRSA